VVGLTVWYEGWAGGGYVQLIDSVPRELFAQSCEASGAVEVRPELHKSGARLVLTN
jgi:hypothetical protein